ncbi:S1/P1 nuclease [Pedobacter sp. MC2016-24]|uniref:S1/P1 nuclease n=1 Tax=Pedobacter sp. MC2016-24 TaxID=2780090 RepID=UPI001882BA52|nr:S1/P1 nuclease [Pedobacter sp. MC2016-24]MBE9598219.1 S1/P1 nuclease [Pedobacter sp. MC2016-24]
MKKNIIICLLFPVIVLLASWGAVGHQTVARIAENHLSTEAQLAVRDLLGNETLAGISSWADQIKSDPDYSHTGPYHFVNLPTGLDYNQFSSAIKTLKNDNLYQALIKYENILADPDVSKQKRAEALKFVVHLVGDAHQPMHISRAEDKGGNTIQVQFDGQGTNLHALWDGKLISRTGKSSEELCKIWDNASPVQILQWQKDPAIKWIYESYLLSNNLYAEIEKGNKIGEDYYNKHISEVQLRIAQGGIRLAGLLNQIFKNYQPSSGSPAINLVEVPIALQNTTEVANYVGKPVSLTGVMYDYKVVNKNLTLLNIGGHYPNQILTVAVRDLQINPADWKDKKIFISGTPQLFKGKVEIEVSDLANIYLKPD